MTASSCRRSSPTSPGCGCSADAAPAAASAPSPTAPAGLEPGSPFGKSIEAIAVYLHYAQAIGIERLRLVFGELFGRSISEGALCNILARAQAPLAAAAAVDRGAGHGRGRGRVGRNLGAGDEADLLGMGVRDRRLRVASSSVPAGAPAWCGRCSATLRPQRVDLRQPRAASAATPMTWQVCLAHLLRDAQYAIDCGDDGFSAAFKRLLLRADCHRAAARPSARHHAGNSIAPIWTAGSTAMHGRCRARGEAAEKLRRRIARDREHLFVFVTDRRCARHQQRIRARATARA